MWMLLVQQIRYTFRLWIPSSGEFPQTYHSGCNEMRFLSNEQNMLINHEREKVLKINKIPVSCPCGVYLKEMDGVYDVRLRTGTAGRPLYGR